MPSLVEELQRDALSPEVPVSQLLRKAKVVATKLDLSDFGTWIEKELNGYIDDDIPTYRQTSGQLKAFNPYRGWIPVMVSDDLEYICDQKMSQRVADLETLARSGAKTFVVQFPPKQANLLMSLLESPMQVKLEIPAISVSSALDSVRNIILDWSLKLEKTGIVGDGLSFSDRDRDIAHSPSVTYQINSIESFTGQMGPVSDHSSVQVGTSAWVPSQELGKLIKAIKANEAQLGLSQEMASTLANAVNNLNVVSKEQVPAPKKISAALNTVKDVLRSASTSLLAKGLLFEIEQLHKHF